MENFPLPVLVADHSFTLLVCYGILLISLVIVATHGVLVFFSTEPFEESLSSTHLWVSPL